MITIQYILIWFRKRAWSESGPALPLTRNRDEDDRFFGRENIIVALCLFGLGLIFFGVI